VATAYNLEFEKPLIELERQIAHLKELAQDEQLDVQREIARSKTKLAALRREIYDGLTPMQRVQVARSPPASLYPRLPRLDLPGLHRAERRPSLPRTTRPSWPAGPGSTANPWW